MYYGQEKREEKNPYFLFAVYFFYTVAQWLFTTIQLPMMMMVSKS